MNKFESGLQSRTWNDNVAIITLPKDHSGPPHIKISPIGELIDGKGELLSVNNFFYVPFKRDSKGEVQAVNQEGPVRAKTVNNALAKLKKFQRLCREGAVAIGNGAFCEVTGDVQRNPNITVFTEVKMGSGRSYHLFLKSIDDFRFSSLDGTEVTLKGGPCLFSDKAVQLETASGQNIKIIDPKAVITESVRNIRVDERISLYEAECIFRLSRCIADFAASFSNADFITVQLDVPKVQYYFYFLDAYKKGFVSRELMEEWMDMVDKRQERILSLMERRVVIHSPNIQIVRTSNLDRLIPYIKDTIHSNSELDLNMIKRILVAEDPRWELVFSVEELQSFVHLGQLSYAIEELKSGLNDTLERRRVGIAVENHPERKIHDKAKTLADKIGRQYPHLSFAMIGVYPLERVFLSTTDEERRETFRSNIYHNDPGHKTVDGRNIIAEIARISR